MRYRDRKCYCIYWDGHRIAAVTPSLSPGFGFPNLLIDPGHFDQSDFEVCYEASCGYGHYHDLLRPLAARVLVAHPGQLRLIFRSKNKTDHKDTEQPGVILGPEEFFQRSAQVAPVIEQLQAKIAELEAKLKTLESKVQDS